MRTLRIFATQYGGLWNLTYHCNNIQVQQIINIHKQFKHLQGMESVLKIEHKVFLADSPCRVAQPLRIQVLLLGPVAKIYKDCPSIGCKFSVMICRLMSFKMCLRSQHSALTLANLWSGGQTGDLNPSKCSLPWSDVIKSCKPRFFLYVLKNEGHEGGILNYRSIKVKLWFPWILSEQHIFAMLRQGLKYLKGLKWIRPSKPRLLELHGSDSVCRSRAHRPLPKPEQRPLLMLHAWKP